jgi:hypothetical protein
MLSERTRPMEIKKEKIKRIAELLKKRTEIYREINEPFIKLTYDNIFLEAAILLLSYNSPERNLTDKEFDEYWSKLEEDYLKFLFEKGKKYLADIKKVVYSLKGKKL